MKRIALLIVLLGFTAGAYAQQFKWVDKDGRLQYGDVPPPGVKAQRLRPPPSGSAAAPSSSAAKKDGEKALSPEAAFQKRQKEAKELEDKAGKDRAEAETQRLNCMAAQSQVRQIQSGQRITGTNAAGERVFLDDSQRALELERAQKAVSESCK
jgi:hypothetical protein